MTTEPPTAAALNEITSAVIACAIEVHRTLGPGLFENTYVRCLGHELTLRRVWWEAKVQLPLVYKELRVERAYEMDLVVGNCVVVEVKAIDRLSPIHSQQLHTYLRLSGHHVGLLLNFGASRMVEGIKRMVNDFPDPCI